MSGTVTPTTETLTANIIAQLESSLEQTIPLLPKAFLRVIAPVLAAVVILVYRYAGFSLLQMFVATASMDWTTVNGVRIRPLVEWGRQTGVGDPIAAVRAELVVTVTVLNQVGTLAAGTQLLRADTEVLYNVVADRALDAATIDVTIRASSDPSGGGGGGDIGNLDPGDIVSFANTPANVVTDAVVVSTAVTGVDAETPDAYRAKILGKSQAAPQGGAYADYRGWGQEAAGVKRIYPYTGAPGEIDVYVEATAAINVDGIPTATELAAAKASINFDKDGLASRSSVNDLVNTIAITRTAFTVEVAGLTVAVGGDLGAVQNAIAAGVDEWLRSREPFIVGLSVLPALDTITQGEVGGVVYEIARAEGASVASVTLKEAAAVITSRTLGTGEKAKLDGGEIVLT